MDGGAEDYESDPEQSRLSLHMRRRQASDDEEEDDYREKRIDSRVSDSESDGQGAAAEYNDEKSDLQEELLHEVEEHFGVSDAQGLKARKNLVDTEVEGVQIGDNVSEIGEGKDQEEKKKNEPSSVPTAGAFYMHDDRFRGSDGGRHRRTLSGKNLWESRDDKKWGHDKFEELTVQDRHYKQGGRVSRGRQQAHGRNKGQTRQYSQVYRPKTQDNNNHSSVPNSGRGKGSRMYRPVTKNSIDTSANKKGPSNSLEKDSHTNTSTTSTSETSQFPSTKTGLNYASAPFYPSGSSNKEVNSTQNKDGQSLQKKETFPVTQINNMQGKNAFDSLNMEKLYIHDSVNPSQQPLLAQNNGRGQAPSILPFMQFPGQQRGGMGVPAVGMAFPGYVGQPNGMGKSEMTWLPVLAGTPGSLGAYHAWTSNQTSLSLSSSKESNINEVDNKVKPYENKELGQRQNRARRYTEMKFGQ